MECYDCATEGTRTPAVAICWSCSAGVCLEHVKEASKDHDRGMYPHCHHDIWNPRVRARRGRVKATAEKI